jgi:hypothetical protein
VGFIVKNVSVSQVTLCPLRFSSGNAISVHTHLTVGSGAIGPYEATLQRDLVFIPPHSWPHMRFKKDSFVISGHHYFSLFQTFPIALAIVIN